MPHIAWIIHGHEDGGVRTAVLNLATGVQELGWAASAMSLSDGPFIDELNARGVPTVSFSLPPIPKLSGSLPHKFMDYARLRRYQARAAALLIAHFSRLPFASQPDALHVLWPNVMPIAARAAHALGKPCFWEMPNVVGRYPFGLNRRILQRQLKKWNVTVLANSRYTAASLGDELVKPIVMYLGADEKRFSPETVVPISRGELGIPSDAVVLGIFARMTESKGAINVVRAISALGGEGCGLHLLLAGPDDNGFMNRLMAEASRLGVRERVHWVGMVPDVERYYGSIDVAVNSRIDAEPFGLSVVDAMMMSKPVLAHALGGPVETILDGKTGWHVPYADPAALAEGIRRALRDRAAWRRMGCAGRMRAIESFSVKRQATFYAGLARGAPA